MKKSLSLCFGLIAATHLATATEISLDFSEIGTRIPNYHENEINKRQGELTFEIDINPSGQVRIKEAGASRFLHADISQAFSGEVLGNIGETPAGSLSITVSSISDLGKPGNIFANVQGTGIGVQGFNAGKINGGGIQGGTATPNPALRESFEEMIWTVDATGLVDTEVVLSSVTISDANRPKTTSPLMRLRHNEQNTDYEITNMQDIQTFDVMDQSIVISGSKDSFSFTQPVDHSEIGSAGFSISALNFKLVKIPEPATVGLASAVLALLAMIAHRRFRPSR
ncbi:MAG: hypothetical protein ACPGN3_06680 [Opitutales bacterium]